MVHCFGGIRTAPVQSAASVRVFGFIWVQGLRVRIWYTNGSSTVGSIGQGLGFIWVQGLRVRIYSVTPVSEYNTYTYLDLYRHVL